MDAGAHRSPDTGHGRRLLREPATLVREGAQAGGDRLPAWQGTQNRQQTIVDPARDPAISTSLEGRRSSGAGSCGIDLLLDEGERRGYAPQWLADSGDAMAMPCGSGSRSVLVTRTAPHPRSSTRVLRALPRGVRSTGDLAESGMVGARRAGSVDRERTGRSGACRVGDVGGMHGRRMGGRRLPIRHPIPPSPRAWKAGGAAVRDRAGLISSLMRGREEGMLRSGRQILGTPWPCHAAAGELHTRRSVLAAPTETDDAGQVDRASTNRTGACRVWQRSSSSVDDASCPSHGGCATAGSRRAALPKGCATGCVLCRQGCTKLFQERPFFRGGHGHPSDFWEAKNQEDCSQATVPPRDSSLRIPWALEAQTDDRRRCLRFSSDLRWGTMAPQCERAILLP